MNEPLAQMFRYNRWANRQLFESCRTLSDEHLDTRHPGASGPVRELLLHIVGGQQTFILRTKGRQHEGELNRESAWPGFERLLELADSSSDELIAIAEGLDQERTADLTWRGETHRYPVSFFLLHALEHGVEHRTEVKMSLAGIGVETPDLDGWPYSAAAGLGSLVT